MIYCSRSCEGQDQGAGGLVLEESHLSGVQGAIFSYITWQRAEREEDGLSMSFIIRAQISRGPTLMTYNPKIQISPSQNTITLGIKLQHRNFGGHQYSFPSTMVTEICENKKFAKQTHTQHTHTINASQPGFLFQLFFFLLLVLFFCFKFHPILSAQMLFSFSIFSLTLKKILHFLIELT